MDPDKTSLQLRSEEVKRYYVRNLFANCLVESGWSFGMSLISEVAILPIFLSELGASKIIIGLLPSLGILFFAIPQLFSAYFTGHRKQKKYLLVLLHTPLVLPIFLIFIFFYFFSPPSALGMAIVLIWYVAFSLSMGSVVPIWGNYIGKIIDPERRGRFFGITRICATVPGMLGALLSSRLIEQFPFPKNFALCFLLAGAATFLGTVPLLLTHEPNSGEEEESARQSLLKELFRVLKEDRNYVAYMIAEMFLSLNFIPISFYAVYARDKVGASPKSAGIFTLSSAIGASAAYLWGYLGDMKGYRIVVFISSLLALVTITISLLSQSIWGFYMVFILMGVSLNGMMNGRMNLLLELCPREDKTLYLAILPTLLAPVRVATPLTGGYLIEQFSYESIFLASMAAIGIGIVWLALRVKEPREVRTSR